MGLELKDVLAQRVQKYGLASIQPMPDGPTIVDRVKPLELAQALEAEVNRAASVGHQNLRLDMGLEDATQLASLLRRMHLMGL